MDEPTPASRPPSRSPSVSSGRAPLALAALTALVAAVGAYWVGADAFPVGQEVCNHLRLAQRIALELEQARRAPEPSIELRAWWSRNHRDGTRATGVHVALAPVYLAAPRAPHRSQTLALGTLSLLVIVAATYWLARTWLDPPGAALAGALLLATPGVWGTARAFAIDLPLAAGLAALAAWLVRVRPSGASLRWAPAIGLAAGALCLVKAQAVLWVPLLVPPVLIGLGWRRGPVWLLLFAVGAAIGCAPYWGGDPGEVAQLAREHIGPGEWPTAERDVAGWRGLSFYARHAPGWLGPALPALALGLVCLAREPRRDVWPLLVWLVGGYAVCTLSSVKWARYLLPALPALCVIGAIGLVSAPAWARRAAVGLALVGGVGLAVATLWVDPPSALGLPGYCHRPRRSNWFEAASRLRVGLGPAAARVETIGVEGTDEFTPDDYTRLALAVRRVFPEAEVVCRIPQFAPFAADELARYDARRDALDLVLVVHPLEGRASPAWRGRTRIDPPPLAPGGEPAGPPRRWSTGVRTGLLRNR